MRSSAPTLDVAIPWIPQAARSCEPTELKGLAADLRAGGARASCRLNRAAGAAARPAAGAVVVHQHGAGAVRGVRDPQHRGRQLRPAGARQIFRSFVGLAGESRVHDANTPVFHIQGVTPAEPGARGRIEPAAPLDPNTPPPHRPDVPCETQEPPDLQAPGGPAEAYSAVGGGLP